MNAGTPVGWRATATVGGLALAGAALIAGMYSATRDRIAAGERQAQRQALAIVLPMDRYDNDPIQDEVVVSAAAWLGDAGPMTVLRARRRGSDAALVLPAVAPDGYAGPIRLLVGVDSAGHVTGVRVTAHKETAGLGDLVDPRKSDWVGRFAGRFLGDPPASRWQVKRDGGDFDQFAGATVTPRAVVGAVRRTLQFVAKHGRAIYDAPAGSRLDFADAPEPFPPEPESAAP